MLHATFARPAGISPSQTRSYEGVVNWKLPTTPPTTVLPPPKAIANTEAPEQLVCKKLPMTGSIAGFERKCMTRSEWDRASSQVHDSWDQIQGVGSPACEGPLCR